MSHDGSQPQRITFGCPILDERLGGGIPCRSLIEIVGESGVGKTQVALQLSLNIQLPYSLGGLSSSAVYIGTDGGFPMRRLNQLRQSFLNRFSDHIQHEPLDKFYIHEIQSIYDFMGQVERIQTILTHSSITDMPIRLIVIDNVTSLFRTYFENNPRDMRRRADIMYEFTAKLREWAVMFNLVVVVINQVIDFMQTVDNFQYHRWEGLITSGRRVCAALGPTWQSRMASRVLMYKDTGNRRFVRAVYSPYFPNVPCEYLICREGVFGVNPENL